MKFTEMLKTIINEDVRSELFLKKFTEPTVDYVLKVLVKILQENHKEELIYFLRIYIRLKMI